MGAAGSVALNDPFPLDEKGRKDLNLLSHITARILATADIYDIYNLNKPGTCGDYSLFLKDKIVQQLLPFASEFNKKDINQKGTSQVYLYQNSLKVFDDAVTRKQICSELATSIMRLVTTVVACLASIQYKEAVDKGPIDIIMAPPPPVATAPAPLRQIGGSRDSVMTWFQTNGYSAAPVPGAAARELILTSPNPLYPNFKLFPIGSTGALTSWILQVDPGSAAGFPILSRGGFRVQIIDPISIPGLPPGSETLLPIRIYETTATWIVGVLRGRVFKLLDDQADTIFDPFEVIFNLFMRSAGQPGELPERQPVRVAQSLAVFQRASLTGPTTILQTLTPYLLRDAPGFDPALIAATAYPRGVPGAPYGIPGYPGYAGGPYGAGSPYGAAPPYGAGGPYGAGTPYGAVAPAYGGVPGTTGYTIPPPYRSGPGIAQPFNVATSAAGYADVPPAAVGIFFKELEIQKRTFVGSSCPAAMRATTLAGSIHRDRTVSTNVCVDEFWKKRTLDTIYPYATLQLLCTDDITKMGSPDPRNMSQTWVDFIEALRQVYPSVPAGAKTQLIPSIEPRDKYFLSQLGYRMGTLDLCKTGPTVTVDYPIVQEALRKINLAYVTHVAKMWDILNALVIVIQDPDTKKDLVRLNPTLLQGSTKKNIDAIATNAMKLIAIHYVEIEKIYTDAVKALQPIQPLVKR
jgi:hypothetical protein